jgi:hypothetical protein
MIHIVKYNKLFLVFLEMGENKRVKICELLLLT